MAGLALNGNAKKVTLIGAGLAGSLLATLLCKRGWQVDVYERRGDPRIKGYESGRSINLALAERGRHALRRAGVEEEVMRQAVLMRGRMVHVDGQAPVLQRYGRDDSEAIWSVHRADLNLTLLKLAENAGARIHFHRRLHTVDFAAGAMKDTYARFIDDRDDQPIDVHFDAPLLGCDGAGSALRAAMNRWSSLGERSEFLGHSYKELEIPPDAGGDFAIDPNALHIWPRGRYMCIALPNDEKTFTVTLFLPNESPPGDDTPSFATVISGTDARALFAREFADAMPLIPRLAEDWDNRPPGLLGTLYLDRWRLGGRALLLGDAAHAMVPFHGQGMNCAFEDCVLLADLLEKHQDSAVAFAEFEWQRKPDAFAIQQMALENYIEMRDRVDDPDFLLQRELEGRLHQRHPGRFVPHYAMVTFMRIPYSVAWERSNVQRGILVDATRGRVTLDGIDWNALDAQVLEKLTMLEDPA